MLSVVIPENIDVVLAAIRSSKLVHIEDAKKTFFLNFPEKDILSCSHTSVRNKIMEAGD